MSEKVTILMDRSGQRPDPDKVSVDLGDLRDSAGLARTDDQPCTLADERGVLRIAQKRPRQAGVIFAVEVDPKVDVVIHAHLPLIIYMVRVGQDLVSAVHQTFDERREIGVAQRDVRRSKRRNDVDPRGFDGGPLKHDHGLESHEA